MEKIPIDAAFISQYTIKAYLKIYLIYIRRISKQNNFI